MFYCSGDINSPHPKIYLTKSSIQKQVTCPYCGIIFE
ncbi:MAG TPA: zinc-finger domain-containing protein [Candidatus Megaira endosymbiont of Hartmannula sinica]|nr:zinc-finger domain-containing protein [Candidatus Megaera endosymbiont of Hartmannula sinica]